MFYFLLLLWLLNGSMIAAQPVMGFNTWNQYGCNGYAANTLMDIADRLTEQREELEGSSLHELGYQYIVVDDCWMSEERTTTGCLQPDPQKFPQGIQTVIQYIHSKGLKFGLYLCVGYGTCMGRPGSMHHYDADVHQFAEWGVDYIKSDFCYVGRSGEEHPVYFYRMLSDAIHQYMPTAVHSMCNWGIGKSWKWASQLGASSWRTTYDIHPHWNCSNQDTVDSYGQGKWPCIEEIVDINAELAAYAGKDKGWNDADMLVVGLQNSHITDPTLPILTEREQRSHFALWCFMLTPLMLATLDSSILSIVGNRQLLAIHQDSLGLQAIRKRLSSVDVWFKKLSGLADGSTRCAILLLNRHPKTPFIVHKHQLSRSRAECIENFTEIHWSTVDQSASILLRPHESRIFITTAAASLNCRCPTHEDPHWDFE